MRRRRHRSLTGGRRVTVWIGLSLALLALLAGLALRHMKPVLSSLATARVSNTVSRIVTAAVDDAVRSGELDYTSLITFEKDREGHITALKSNMAEFSRLQSMIADQVLLRLSDVSDSVLSVPIGTLSGSALLSGRGPKLRVHMQSAGTADARFQNTFSAAGINQTRHQIILAVDVSVSILLPMFRTSTTVSQEIAVGETVIVGRVPQHFTSFAADPDGAACCTENHILHQNRPARLSAAGSSQII